MRMNLFIDKLASDGFEEKATVKITLAIVLVLLLVGIPALAEDLVKLGLDDVSSLGLKIESDSRTLGILGTL